MISFADATRIDSILVYCMSGLTNVNKAHFSTKQTLFIFGYNNYLCYKCDKSYLKVVRMLTGSIFVLYFDLFKGYYLPLAHSQLFILISASLNCKVNSGNKEGLFSAATGS